MKRPPDTGLLVVLEGVDGSGKSTLARELAGRLAALGFPVVSSREPTDGPHGRRLRESATLGRLSPTEELETFIADRQEHVAQRILPNLAAGRIVVLDRYYFSTAAYQGARGLDWREILRRNEAFAPEPDVLLLLQMDPRLSLERIRKRGEVANEFERLENLEKVAGIFGAIEFHPGWVRLDATLPPEALCLQALAAVRAAAEARGTRRGA